MAAVGAPKADSVIWGASEHEDGPFLHNAWRGRERVLFRYRSDNEWDDEAVVGHVGPLTELGGPRALYFAMSFVNVLRKLAQEVTTMLVKRLSPQQSPYHDTLRPHPCEAAVRLTWGSGEDERVELHGRFYDLAPKAPQGGSEWTVLMGKHVLVGSEEDVMQPGKRLASLSTTRKLRLGTLSSSDVLIRASSGGRSWDHDAKRIRSTEARDALAKLCALARGCVERGSAAASVTVRADEAKPEFFGLAKGPGLATERGHFQAAIECQGKLRLVAATTAEFQDF